jgi:hypothetical protein
MLVPVGKCGRQLRIADRVRKSVDGQSALGQLLTREVAWLLIQLVRLLLETPLSASLAATVSRSLADAVLAVWPRASEPGTKRQVFDLPDGSEAG